jgi:hypothetical protein
LGSPALTGKAGLVFKAGMTTDSVAAVS